MTTRRNHRRTEESFINAIIIGNQSTSTNDDLPITEASSSAPSAHERQPDDRHERPDERAVERTIRRVSRWASREAIGHELSQTTSELKCARQASSEMKGLRFPRHERVLLAKKELGEKSGEN
jgi:hypothetical protein